MGGCLLETTPFGQSLRHWRRVRGVSQLQLAATASTTTRHLSYLETGRSRPSRQMVDRLGEALEMGLRDRNRLMEAAGFAPTYREGDLAADDLAPFARVVDHLLASHEPYPGFVVDRHWNIERANSAARLLLPVPYDHHVSEGPSVRVNTIEMLLEGWRDVIDNWDVVAPALLDRISDDLARSPDDPELQRLHARVAEAVDDPRRPRDPPHASRVICPHFRLGGQLVRTITVAARFESTIDVTLDELRVELIYPEDEAAERFFQERAADLDGHGSAWR